MRRILRPGLLVTVSVAATATACANPFAAKGEDALVIHNPPAPPAPPLVVATFPSGPVTPNQVLNPRDAEGRTIRRSPRDGDCYVELPFPEPPTSVRPAPKQAVACPTQMLEDPAWSGCLGGTLRVAKIQPLDCVCDFFGNPPPPPQAVVCPREVAGRLSASAPQRGIPELTAPR